MTERSDDTVPGIQTRAVRKKRISSGAQLTISERLLLDLHSTDDPDTQLAAIKKALHDSLERGRVEGQGQVAAVRADFKAEQHARRLIGAQLTDARLALVAYERTGDAAAWAKLREILTEKVE